MTAQSESVLVRLAQRGDQAAFERLVALRQSWIRNLLRRASGDAELGDDLAQEVFLNAWKHLSRLRDPARFGPWLRRLAINQWLQHARKRQPDALLEDPEVVMDQAPAMPGLARDLNEALAMLSPAARVCVVLSYNEGMSHPEIAEVTGFPPGTVKSHVRRGTERLRKLLADYRAG